MTVKTKRSLCALISLMLCVGLASCGASNNDTQPTQSEAASGSPTKVTMYGVPDPQISAAQVIADVNGYYEDEGLDVTVNMLANSSEINPMFASGECDIAFTGSYACIQMANSDVPVKCVCPMTNIGGTQAVIVGKDVEINDIKDLEGKTIAVASGSEAEIVLRNMCQELGVDYNSFNTINVMGADMLSALEKGDIDAAAAWEPWITNAEKIGAKFLCSGTKSEIPGHEGDADFLNVYGVMAASDSYIANNKETIAKILRAVKKATDFINNNRSEAIDILSKEFDIDASDLESIMSRNDYTMGVSQSYLDSTNWLANYAYENNVITKSLTASDYSDFSILKETLPELYTANE